MALAVQEVRFKDNRSPYRFSLKTKTIFEETKKPLRTWFKVLHLMLTSKKGMSALQIHRLIGTGTYRKRVVYVHEATRWNARYKGFTSS